MILRFSSGSLTPASAARKRSWASTTLSDTPVAATKSRSTCSGSPARSRPWSTKTQVRWSPMARCTSAAATAESTPAGQPAQHPLVADGGADRGDLLVDDVGHRPRGLGAGDLVEEVLEHRLPVLGVEHLRVELHAGHAAAEVLEGRHLGAGGSRRHREALGRAPTRSRRGSSTPTGRPAGPGTASTSGSVTVSEVRPNSASPVRSTVPPSASAMAWKP